MLLRATWLVAALLLGIAGALLASNTLPVLLNGGFPMSSSEHFETPTHALVFADAEERAYDADTWSGGDTSNGFRLEATSPEGKRLFVGLARADQVVGLRHGPHVAPCPHAVPRGYLEGASYQLVGGSPSRVRGRRQPESPTVESWDATAVGATGKVQWASRPGGAEPCRLLYWYPVVMNADGSPGVRADVRFGARELPLAVIASSVAVALLLAAAFAARKALRPRAAPFRDESSTTLKGV